MTNTAGINKTLRAMNAAGLLEDVDAAVVSLAKGLAAAVDADPGNAALWRELRAAVTTLREAGDSGVGDDDAAAFLALISTPAVSAPLGHPTD